MTVIDEAPGRITLDDVTALGDVDDALREFYDQQVASAAAATGVSEREIRDWVEHELITDGGFRGQALEGPAGTGDLVPRALQDAHLIRAETRRGTNWYEIAHDRMVEPVLAGNARWREVHLSSLQVAAMDWEGHDRTDDLLLRGEVLDEARTWALANDARLSQVDRDFLVASDAAAAAILLEQRRQRRTRIFAVVAAALAVLAFGGLLVAVRAYNALDTEESLREEAEATLLEAEELLAEAEGQAADAEQRFKEASEARAAAEEQLADAREASSDADAALVDAKAAQRAAEEAEAEARQEAAVLLREAEVDRERAVAAEEEAARLLADAELAEQLAAEATQEATERAEQAAVLQEQADLAQQRADDALERAAASEEVIQLLIDELEEVRVDPLTFRSLFAGLTIDPGGDAALGTLCAIPRTDCSFSRPPVNSASNVRIVGSIPASVEPDNPPTVSRDFVAAIEFGDGRAVVYAHDGLPSDGALGLAQNERFFTKALSYVLNPEIRGRTIDVVLVPGFENSANTEGFRRDVEARGWKFRELDMSGNIRSQLSEAEAVLFGNPWPSNPRQSWHAWPPDAEQAILDFVDDGGGLVLGGLGWSYHAYADIPSDSADWSLYPANRISSALGVAFTYDIYPSQPIRLVID